jgi:FkbM family methyltransferase
LGTAALQWPRGTTLLDGNRYLLPRHLANEVRHWLGWEKLEHEARTAFESYGGGDVVDVGAYLGAYSAFLAPRARPGDTFVSLEPDPQAYAALQENLAALGRAFPRVSFIALPTAAGTGASASLSRPLGPGGHLRIDTAQPGEPTVPSVALDQLVEALRLHPAFVKIDVEGAELSVLKGAVGLLTKDRPTVALEIHTAWKPGVDEIDQLLKDAGYVCSTTWGGEILRTIWTPGRDS